MRLDDICSPGYVSNSHNLRKEVVKAISFCEITGSSEKALELISFFREAIAYLDRELLSEDSVESEKVVVDVAAVSPFDEEVGQPIPVTDGEVHVETKPNVSKKSAKKV